ncbi:unnamed protein product [Urochloa decumbens]|uniref:Uncharacterized protein n=1 Tax=Urochloa decumbens TaxID=240449 RepID=A0ABC9G7G3_9POAL
MARANNFDVTVVLGLSLVALLLLSGAGVQHAAADGDIGYHAMSADEVPGRNHALFRPGAVANKYSRGCESEEQCRSM